MVRQGHLDLPEEGEPSVSDQDGPAVWTVGLRRAIAELGPMPERQQMLENAPRTLCEHTPFERTIVSAVEGSKLLLVNIHFEAQESQQRVVKELWKADPPVLTHLLVESEVVRRNRAILVVDASTNERTHREIGRATRTTSYVAAPITQDGRVVGMVHADRQSTGVQVGQTEHEALWLFCQALSLACERAELARRLRRQRDDVKRHLAALDTVIDDDSGWQRPGSDGLAAASDMQLAAAGVVLAPESRIAALLTARELEVLELMAEGSTNADIAARLVITEGTVKSHVKHVLRKMRASNRVEAVSRYLRILGKYESQAAGRANRGP